MNAWRRKQRRAALAAAIEFCNRASEARRRAIDGDLLALLTLEADRWLTMGHVSKILHTPQFYDAAARVVTAGPSGGAVTGWVVIQGGTPEDWAQEVADCVRRTD